MKNLQKKIALSGLIFLSVLLFSCSKDEVVGSNASDNKSSSNYAVTPADQLIASPEFTAFEKVSKEARKRFMSNFSKLSDAERDLFGILLNEARFTSNEAQINEIIEKMNSLTGLDFVRESNRLKRYAEPLNVKNNGISNKEFLISLKKRQLAKSSSPFIKDGNETNQEELDEKAQQCHIDCDIAYLKDALLCGAIPLAPAVIICEGIALYDFYRCKEECEEIRKGN